MQLQQPLQLLQQKQKQQITIENDRPTDLINLITNHNNVSPEQTTQFTSNWNNDSWTDGEFEPIDEGILTGKTRQNIANQKQHVFF